MNTFYISPQAEDGIHIGFRVIFVVSCLLNMLCFVCLIKKTPRHQTTFRNYLIFIQILLTLNDISIDVLFEPIPLFPAYAGYCVGILCRLGVPLQYSLVVDGADDDRHLHFDYSVVVEAAAVFLLANVGVSIVVCCLYRHQTILLSGSIFKLKRRTLTAARSILFVLFSLTGLALFIPLDTSQTDHLLDTFSPDITWIRCRGSYTMYQRTSSIIGIFLFLLAVILVAMFSVLLMFTHLIYTLQKEYKNIPSSLIRQRKSLQIFFVQLGVPIALLIIPALTMLTGLIFEVIPFEICLGAYFMLPLHPIGHNLILLAVTPSYRNFIWHLIRGGACGLRRQKPPSASIRFVSMKSLGGWQ